MYVEYGDKKAKPEAFKWHIEFNKAYQNPTTEEAKPQEKPVSKPESKRNPTTSLRDHIRAVKAA